MPRLPIAVDERHDEDVATLLGWARSLLQLCQAGALPARSAYDPRYRPHGHHRLVGNPCLLGEHFGDPAVLSKAEQQLSEGFVAIATKLPSCYGRSQMKRRNA